MIGIVILNYNDYETTIIFLKQIRKYQCIDYICIVDNASTDESVEKLRPYCIDNVHIILLEENDGYSSGNNSGIKFLVEEKACQYIFVSNPDIEVEELAIINMVETINSDPTIALLGPTIHENNAVNRGWKLPTILDDILANLPLISKSANKKLLYDESHYQSILSKVEVVSGCFFLVRADVLEHINYFDENTFLYYEENILGKKLKDKRYQSYILNTTKVIHHHSISIDKNVAHLNKIKILKESQRYYQKNYNNASFIGIIGLYITYYIYMVLSYITIALKQVVK